MAYEFQKLSEVEVLSEVPEGASVLAEVNGDIKRVPGTGLGGNGGKTLIIDADMGDGTSSPVVTANMTFEELSESFHNHELTGACCYETLDCRTIMVMCFVTDVSADFDRGCFVVGDLMQEMVFFITSDGISTEEPSSGGGGGVAS